MTLGSAARRLVRPRTENSGAENSGAENSEAAEAVWPRGRSAASARAAAVRGNFVADRGSAERRIGLLRTQGTQRNTDHPVIPAHKTGPA
ncbi:hypothetical protein GCM10010185_13910 [Saccharothrix coeruleofusca]|uniref:Uncharacterized protein n=1 Tax=Saccharothrix coeruleofusca TaxID=33919 RepID=A0A918AJ04_9PSEU|nr:hypothetical protein GCM10010185_13910 [Saccharothrix coeruleofusca]